MSRSELALLGGPPEFGNLVPITKPTIPAVPDVLGDFEEILRTGLVTKGRHLKTLERAVGDMSGSHCAGVSSCTIGLLLVLRALGIEGECILPSFTFMATAAAPSILGLPLRFVDIDDETWTIDVGAVRDAINPRTEAVIAVHTFGVPANIEELEDLCAQRAIALVFDAAHGLGSRYRGRQVGFGGDAESFSLSPTKLVVAGEGGLVCSRRRRLIEAIEILREYGNAGAYSTEVAGVNGRMDEMSAALAVRSLAILEENVSARHRLVALVRERLAAVPGIRFQSTREGDRSSLKDFSLTIDEHEFGLSRDTLCEVLRAENVDTRKYFDPLVHAQPAYSLNSAESLAVSERISSTILSLPLWSHMPPDYASKIAELVATAHREAGRINSVQAR